MPRNRPSGLVLCVLITAFPSMIQTKDRKTAMHTTDVEDANLSGKHWVFASLPAERDEGEEVLFLYSSPDPVLPYTHDIPQNMHSPRSVGFGYRGIDVGNGLTVDVDQDREAETPRTSCIASFRLV